MTLPRSINWFAIWIEVTLVIFPIHDACDHSDTRAMIKSHVTSLLSLSQRERIQVRDYSGHVFQALTKWPGERYRVLCELDDSRSERRQFLVWPEILLVPGRVFHGGGSHGLNHPIRRQASRPDNKNPERRVDRVLPPEFVACKVSISKTTPEDAFAVGRVFAEITGVSH